MTESGLLLHIHFDIHKTLLSKSGITEYKHVLPSLCIYTGKNTLDETVLKKPILLQRCHSLMHPFTNEDRKLIQLLFHYQTYQKSGISERYFNRISKTSTYYQRHHSFHLLLKWLPWPEVINTAESVCSIPDLYEKVSFASDLERFKQFITILSKRNIQKCFLQIRQ